MLVKHAADPDAALWKDILPVDWYQCEPFQLIMCLKDINYLGIHIPLKYISIKHGEVYNLWLQVWSPP